MVKFIAAMAGLLRTLAAATAVGLLGYGGWVGYRTYHAQDLVLQERDEQLAAKSAEITRLSENLQKKQAQIERLLAAIRLLKVDHRVAQVVVLDQEVPAEGGRPWTKLKFVEVDGQGGPLDEPRVFTIDGDVLYVDAWVLKFADEHVEAGDPLRATSVCLFRRLFGEYQEPADGFELDAMGLRPAAYSRGSEMSQLEREIWSNFWEYANDPRKAEAAGVRAAHGEAPSIKLQKGKIYKLELRASGGLTIKSDDLPAAVSDPAL